MRFWIIAAAFIPLRFWPWLERRLENYSAAAADLPYDMGIERELTSGIARSIIDARRERRAFAAERAGA